MCNLNGVQHSQSHSYDPNEVAKPLRTDERQNKDERCLPRRVETRFCVLQTLEVSLTGELVEVVLAAVKQNGTALRYASEVLQNHREVVMASVHRSGALQCPTHLVRNPHMTPKFENAEKDTPNFALPQVPVPSQS
eukprot:4382955-Amphidinium_carterae.1